MGAWGTGLFDNDTASDFVDEVVRGRDFRRIEESLSSVVSTGANYLQAPDAEEALVAADVVARLKGRMGEKTASTEVIDKWVRDHASLTPSEALIEKARSAVRRILTEPSELLELFQESDEFAEWKANVDSLLARLA